MAKNTQPETPREVAGLLRKLQDKQEESEGLRLRLERARKELEKCADEVLALRKEVEVRVKSVCAAIEVKNQYFEELQRWRNGGVTEEMLRREKDGGIKLANGCAVVLWDQWEELVKAVKIPDAIIIKFLDASPNVQRFSLGCRNGGWQAEILDAMGFISQGGVAGSAQSAIDNLQSVMLPNV